MAVENLDQIINSTAPQINTNTWWNYFFNSNQYSEQLTKLYGLAVIQDRENEESIDTARSKSSSQIKTLGKIIGYFKPTAGLITYLSSYIFDHSCKCVFKMNGHRLYDPSPGRLMNLYTFWKKHSYLNGKDAFNQYIANIQTRANIQVYIPSIDEVNQYVKKNRGIGFWQAKLEIVNNHYYKQLEPPTEDNVPF